MFLKQSYKNNFIKWSLCMLLLKRIFKYIFLDQIKYLQRLILDLNVIHYKKLNN